MKEEEFLFGESDLQNKSNFDVKRFISSVIRKWPWFLISIFIFCLGAWIYTRYLTDYYKSTIKIIVKGENLSTSEALLKDVAYTPNTNGGIENEMQLLKSTKIMKDVVEKLDLDVSYFSEGNIIDVERYGDEIPYQIKVLNNPNNKNYIFKVKVENNIANIILGDSKTKTVEIGHTFTIDNSVFKIIDNNNFKSKVSNDSYRVEIEDKEYVARNLKNLIEIDVVNNYSTALYVSLEYPNTKKAEDILNQLMKSYNKEAISDKNSEFDKTEEFIAERIAILNDELGQVENKKEDFQTGNDIANLETEVGMSIANKANLQNELLNTDTQLSLINSYKNYVKNQGVNDILPSDVSNSGNNTNSAVSSYNKMVASRKSLIASGATPEHPEVQSLTQSILDAKSTILANIQKQEQALLQTRKGLNNQLGSASSLKRKAPKLEKKARDIERQRSIKESLYLLLLQKREEAAISSAITQDKAKIIDPPLSTGPVRPKKSIFYLGALALGFLLPLGIIYLQNVFRNKIETRRDLESLSKDIPILGELPSIDDSKTKDIQVQNNIDEISEAFRVLRTNAEFVLSQIESKENKKGKVILITSSIKGEGKTFVSMNYAHVLSQIKDKKVIIIGADIRNPQLHRYTTLNKNTEGLTEFLYHNDDNKDLPAINVSAHDNKTDIIFSGQIPPNPTELLMSKKIPTMLDKLRDIYDYIIIDSAPILVVSDTFNLTEFADMTIFVTRSNYTPKEVIKNPIELYKKDRINHLCFVLNDISKSAHGYGYGYGYGYNYGYGYGYKADNENKSLFNKLNPFKK